MPAPPRPPAPDVTENTAIYSGRAGSAEPDNLDGGAKLVPQPIVDVDLDDIEDKKWRKPGVNLADFFNYGFDEQTWVNWAKRQRESRQDRDRERENPFHVRGYPATLTAFNAKLRIPFMTTDFRTSTPPGGLEYIAYGAQGDDDADHNVVF